MRLAAPLNFLARISLARKLLLLAALFGIPLLIASGMLFWQLMQREAALRAERAALDLQVPALRLLGAAHLAAAHGQVGAGGSAAGTTVSRELTALEKAVADSADGPHHEVTRHWLENLRASEPGLATVSADTAAQMAEAFSKTWHEGLDRVNETAHLAVDGELASSRLIGLLTVQIPALIEINGRAARLSAAALTRKRLNSSLRAELTTLRGGIDPQISWSIDVLGQVAERRPDLRPALDGASGQLNTALASVQEALTTRVLEASELDLAAEEFIGRSQGAQAELIAVAEGIAGGIGMLLDQRIAALVTQRYLFVLGLVLILGGVALGFLLTYRGIMRGIGELAAGVDAVAAGDLTRRLPVTSRDEIGIISRHFNGMTESFSTIILGTLAAAGELGGAVRSVAAGSARITESSAHQSRLAESIAATLEELTVSISEVAEHAAATNTIAADASKIAGAEAERAQAAIFRMRELLPRVSEATANIRRLETRSQEIGQIVRVIQEIADQTNLLALNAAIEAARAGEAGRGFAVVADEVRKLADRTSQSTRDIDTMVRGIQEETTHMVTSMGEAEGGIAHSAEMVNELASAMNTLRFAVDTSASHVRDIVAATEAERNSSLAIARQVQDMADMANSNHEALREADATTLALQTMAGRLRDSVAELRVE
jgi:methyl-accepting chemotaxis protein